MSAMLWSPCCGPRVEVGYQSKGRCRCHRLVREESPAVVCYSEIFEDSANLTALRVVADRSPAYRTFDAYTSHHPITPLKALYSAEPADTTTRTCIKCCAIFTQPHYPFNLSSIYHVLCRLCSFSAPARRCHQCSPSRRDGTTNSLPRKQGPRPR